MVIRTFILNFQTEMQFCEVSKSISENCEVTKKMVEVWGQPTPPSRAPTTAAQQPHFRDDPLIPIYSSGKDRSFSSKNVAEEIMNGVSTHLISSLVPHQPNENIAFMIGTQYLGHWKDVLSDNLGSWKNDGTKTLYYSTSHKASREIKLKPTSEEDAEVLVYRYLYVYIPKRPLSNELWWQCRSR